MTVPFTAVPLPCRGRVRPGHTHGACVTGTQQAVDTSAQSTVIPHGFTCTPHHRQSQRLGAEAAQGWRERLGGAESQAPGGGSQEDERSSGGGSGCAGLARPSRPARGGGMRAACATLRSRAGMAQDSSRSDPVLSSQTSSRPDLEPVWGRGGWDHSQPGLRTGSAWLRSPGAVGGEAGPGQSVCRGFGVSQSRRGADPRPRPQGPSSPPESKNSSSQSPPSLVEPCALSCSGQAPCPGPKAQLEHGCWEAQVVPRGGGGGEEAAGWHGGARGCADSGTPSAAEPLQGPRLIPPSSSRPGPPGECPLETAQPSRAASPRARVSLSIVFLSENSGHPDLTARAEAELSCGSPSRPLSPRTLPGPLMVTQPLLLAPHRPWAWCPVGPRPPLLLVPDSGRFFFHP